MAEKERVKSFVLAMFKAKSILKDEDKIKERMKEYITVNDRLKPIWKDANS